MIALIYDAADQPFAVIHGPRDVVIANVPEGGAWRALIDGLPRIGPPPPLSALPAPEGFR